MPRTDPFSTYKTYLYKDTTKLIDIKDFSEPYNAREMLDSTVVKSDARTFTPGIRENTKITFTCNYTHDTFEMLDKLGNTEYLFSIRFGDDAVDGKFEFKGKLSVELKGGGVNEVVEMVITIAPTTAVTFS